jgi:DNA-binding CsgD family transcriptional regulator
MDTGRFVGRSGELARLQDLVAGLAAGTGGTLLVVGEQGIGKSALLREGVPPAGPYRLGWGTADEMGQHFPLMLMMECLGQEGQLAVDGEAAGSGGPVSGQPTAATWGGGAGDRLLAGNPVLAAAERLLALVDQLCAVSPVAIVAEDLHWADEASLLVWQRLSRAVTQLPLLVIGSCRPAPRRADVERLRHALAASGEVLELEPLPPQEVGALAAGLLGAQPGQRLAGLLDRAAGNPLYATELLDALVRDGEVKTDAGVAELAGEPDRVRVPESLAAAIDERLSSLPGPAGSVLRWAAVLGQEFSVTDLGLVTSQSADELTAVVGQAVTAGVVVEAGPRLGFRHGLIRQALYQGIPGAMRDALHLQAARALAEAGAPADRVAAHLVGTSEVTGEWVWEWLAGAATALTYRAPQVAAELLRRALTQLAEEPLREALEIALVRVALLLVLDEEVERVATRILASTHDPDHAAEVAWLLAYSLARSGQRTEAAVDVVRAALARPGTSDMWPIRLRALHAMLLGAMGQWDQAATTAREVTEGEERPTDPFALGYALHALFLVAYREQDYAAMLSYLDQALAAVGDDPQAIDLRLLLLTNRAGMLVNLDRHAEAAAALQQALAPAEQAGAARLAGIYAMTGQAYFLAGQWDDAITMLELAADLPGPDFMSIIVLGLLALIAAHRDDADMAAERLAAVSDQQVEATRYRASVGYLLLARALIAERAGRPGEAAAVLAESLEPGLAEPQGYLLLPTLTRLALTIGDTDTAARAAQVAGDHEPLPVKNAAADHCRGLVAGDPGPLLAAAAYYESADRPLDRATTLEDAAVLLAEHGDLSGARQAFREAAGLYGALNAGWDLRRADSRLRGYGIRRGPAGRQARPEQGWDALTPTEMKIARLVAHGQPNPEIAAALFLSRNTVKTHVSHILAKLGARSRVEIIRQALQHPAAN